MSRGSLSPSLCNKSKNSTVVIEKNSKQFTMGQSFGSSSTNKSDTEGGRPHTRPLQGISVYTASQQCSNLCQVTPQDDQIDHTADQIDRMAGNTSDTYADHLKIIPQAELLSTQGQRINSLIENFRTQMNAELQTALDIIMMGNAANQRELQLKQLLEDKEAEIEDLKTEVKTLKQELHEEREKLKQPLMQCSDLPPHEVDQQYRGCTSESELEDVEQQVCHFYGEKYPEILDSDDAQQINEADLGTLMVTLSQLCYTGARNVSIHSISGLFFELFRYHANPTDEIRDALVHLQQAYGLLLFHKKKLSTGHKGFLQGLSIKEVETEVNKLLRSKENKKCQNLLTRINANPQKEFLQKFIHELLEQSISMVSISPPMVIHTQDTFDKRMALEVRSKNPTPPLLWIQPVLMANWTGKVCEKGRADNREQILQNIT